MWEEGGQDKEGDRETGGGRPKKISIRTDGCREDGEEDKEESGEKKRARVAGERGENEGGVR